MWWITTFEVALPGSEASHERDKPTPARLVRVPVPHLGGRLALLRRGWSGPADSVWLQRQALEAFAAACKITPEEAFAPVGNGCLRVVRTIPPLEEGTARNVQFQGAPGLWFMLGRLQGFLVLHLPVMS